jgi:GDP-mannose 6-dehydrogenase
MVTLIEQLIGKGMQLSIYDSHVSSANVIGANKEYVEKEIPHIWELMRPSVGEVLSGAETLVIGNGSPEFRGLRDQLNDGQVVIDLARAFGARVSEGKKYQGICW